MKPTAEQIKSVLHYDPETGIFTWLESPQGRVMAGSVAGSITYQGYVSIKFGRKPYFAHRLAWLYMTGEWPPDCIDHINGIKNDNRIENLRPATVHQNLQNQYGKGYRFRPEKSKKNPWIAQIKINGKTKHLGSFATKDEAIFAYEIAKIEIRGEFAHKNGG